jgi:hypothetical protein
MLTPTRRQTAHADVLHRLPGGLRHHGHRPGQLRAVQPRLHRAHQRLCGLLLVPGGFLPAPQRTGAQSRTGACVTCSTRRLCVSQRSPAPSWSLAVRAKSTTSVRPCSPLRQAHLLPRPALLVATPTPATPPRARSARRASGPRTRAPRCARSAPTAPSRSRKPRSASPATLVPTGEPAARARAARRVTRRFAARPLTAPRSRHARSASAAASRAAPDSPPVCLADRCVAAPRASSPAAEAGVQGTAASQPGSVFCPLCPVGTYMANSNATLCLDCGLGTRVARAAPRVPDEPCAGQFASTSGSTSCFPCGAGSFTQQTGALRSRARATAHLAARGRGRHLRAVPHRQVQPFFGRHCLRRLPQRQRADPDRSSQVGPRSAAHSAAHRSPLITRSARCAAAGRAPRAQP